VWDVVTHRVALTLRGHSANVSCAAFSPDGERIATTSTDSTIKFWHAATGQETLTLPGTNQIVQGLALSPDGLRLATCGPGAGARIWNVTPLGTEELDRREALSVLHYWLARSTRSEQLSERIEQDRSIGESIRREALKIATEREQGLARQNSQ
jgi:WD40 repeat protein